MGARYSHPFGALMCPHTPFSRGTDLNFILLWGHFVSPYPSLMKMAYIYTSIVEGVDSRPLHWRGGAGDACVSRYLRWCRFDRLLRLLRFPPVVKQARFMDPAA
jgi:hypothetical protein